MNWLEILVVKVKFCGLKRPCDIAWANELHPDYAGFVFAGQKRRVSDDQAAALRKDLDPGIPAVGVFVDDSLEHMGKLVAAGTIQIVQLHGQEDDAMIDAVRQSLQVPVIKAFSIVSEADIRQPSKAGPIISCSTTAPAGQGIASTGPCWPTSTDRTFWPAASIRTMPPKRQSSILLPWM